MNNPMPATGASANRSANRPYTVVRGGLGDTPARRAGERLVDGVPPLNHLLAGLPAVEFHRLLPHLERVDMAPGDIIYEHAGDSRYVYFPATAIVSLVYEMEDGATSEVAIVGSEGMAGVGLFLAGETMPGLAVVQCGGHGYRLCSLILREAADRSRAVRDVLLCYAEALLVQIAQNAACSRHHPIGKQLCRRLLLTLDRAAGNSIALTHESIASSLGVRRECVTVAAGKLRKDGLIDYRHGNLTILDRKALEAQACECYGVVRRAFDRLLGPGGSEAVAAGDGIRHSPESPVRAMAPESHTGHLRALK